ncbi:MAG TPA: DinB family protein, partial [Acidimicrobiia bacterium]|nr:DinB family protein [Acidimicrobiia bacterium]
MSADDVRAENARLDEALLAEAQAFEPARLTDAPDGEWSAAQVLAHLGEFPRFFAGELRRWYDDRSAVIGRTMEHPVRLAAVESPADALGELVAGMRAAFAELAAVLEALSDDDV